MWYRVLKNSCIILNRVLTQIKITNKQNVLQVLEWFHSRGVKVVVITSISLHEDDDERRLIGFASHSADPKGNEFYHKSQLILNLLFR